MADKSQEINGFTDDLIHSSISIEEASYQNKNSELVVFYWNPQHKYSTSHKCWQCFDYITSWLKENDAHFTVSSFQRNQCSIYIHDTRIRFAIKMMFSHVNTPRDPDDDAGSISYF